MLVTAADLDKLADCLGLGPAASRWSSTVRQNVREAYELAQLCWMCPPNAQAELTKASTFAA
jgi:hypothetical protein